VCTISCCNRISSELEFTTMRNLLFAASLLISTCSLSSLVAALDVGGAVGGAVGAAGGAVGGAARGAAGAVGGAAGAVGGAAGNAVGAVGGAARGAVGTVGGIAGGAAAAVGGVAAGTVGGAISGTGAIGRSVGTVGSTPTSTGGLVGSFGAPATASRSLAAPSEGSASLASRRSWMLAPPRKVNTLIYFPVESLYRRKPRQIRELLVKLDHDLLRTIRTSCRQVLAMPRSFTREHVQVCRIARSL
jgi:hypothetical protein